MKSFILFCVCICFLVTPCIAGERELCDVIKVVDGDTYKLYCPSFGPVEKMDKRGHIVPNSKNCRLYGIDAPEKSQQESFLSIDYLNSLGNKIYAEFLGNDIHGRPVVLLYDNDNNFINYELVKRGLVYVYNDYCKLYFCKAFKDAENYAQVNKIGLWGYDNLEKPWDYRHHK